jgi:hypothetical protein
MSRKGARSGLEAPGVELPAEMAPQFAAGIEPPKPWVLSGGKPSAFSI